MCCISGTFLLHVLVLKLLGFSNIGMRHSSSAICLPWTIRSLSVLGIATASSDSSNICAGLGFIIFPYSAALFSASCSKNEVWLTPGRFVRYVVIRLLLFLRIKIGFFVICHVYVCMCWWGSKEGFRCSRVGVMGVRELSYVVLGTELRFSKKLQVFFTTEQYRWPWEWCPLKVAVWTSSDISVACMHLSLSQLGIS